MEKIFKFVGEERFFETVKVVAYKIILYNLTTFLYINNDSYEDKEDLANLYEHLGGIEMVLPAKHDYKHSFVVESIIGPKGKEPAPFLSRIQTFTKYYYITWVYDCTHNPLTSHMMHYIRIIMKNLLEYPIKEQEHALHAGIYTLAQVKFLATTYASFKEPKKEHAEAVPI